MYVSAPYSTCSSLCVYQLHTVHVLRCVSISSIQYMFFAVCVSAPYSTCSSLCVYQLHTVHVPQCVYQLHTVHVPLL